MCSPLREPGWWKPAGSGRSQWSAEGVGKRGNCAEYPRRRAHVSCQERDGASKSAGVFPKQGGTADNISVLDISQGRFLRFLTKIRKGDK